MTSAARAGASRREGWLDALRVLAAFGVIVNHTNSKVFQALMPQDAQWWLSVGWYYVSKMAVPLFVMVSGACLLPRRDSPRRVLGRMARILGALLLFSYAYYLYDAWVYWGLWPRMADLGTFLRLVWTQQITDSFWYLTFYLALLAMLPFLQRLASARGVNVKVHDGRLVCEAAKRGDARAATVAISRTGGQFSPSRWSFKEKSEGTAYCGCDVQYMDPESGEMHSYSFGEPGADGQREKITLINQKVESKAEAETFAQSALRNKNEAENTGSLDIMGHPGLVAGCTLTLDGFGTFDGKYFVTTATHRIEGKYTTGVELRRTLDY